MQTDRITDFFDSKVQKAVTTDGGFIYKMQNETGTGVVTQYHILPGIELFYNDFHMRDGKNKNKLPYNKVIEINHCREGRFECVFSNGDHQYIGAGDLAINRLSNETVTNIFPMAHYHGISITIDLDEGARTIHDIENIMGTLHIDLESISERFCKKESCFVLRNRDAIRHIFSELYRVSPNMIAHYLKIKVLELLMYLNDVEANEYVQEKRYFSKNQVQIIKEIEQYMTKDLKTHYTLKDLSKKFNIPLTTMKICFKSVFGSSIYSYMKSYRMETALLLLENTNESITDIALKMGYDNPSKFSEAFKKKMGHLPSYYRKNLTK